MDLGETAICCGPEGVLTRRCPHTGCVCLMPLVGGLDLLWIQVVSFLRVCWQLPPWWGLWGWRWERLELDPGVRWDLPCAHWPSLPYSGWNRPQVAKAEAWMLGPELALFPLGCVSHSPILRPLVPERWRAAASGACENLGLGSGQTSAPEGVRAVSRLLPVRAAAMVPLAPLRQTRVSVLLVPHSDRCPSLHAHRPAPPMWPHRRAMGPMWTQHASGDELSKHQRWPPAPSWPPLWLVTSGSPGLLAHRVLCLPVAAPDPGRHWDRECDQGALSAWAGARWGNSARADLLLPCPGEKPEHTPLKSRAQASLSLAVAPVFPNHQGLMFPTQGPRKGGTPSTASPLTPEARGLPKRSPFSSESPSSSIGPDWFSLRPFLPGCLCIFLTALVV